LIAPYKVKGEVGGEEMFKIWDKVAELFFLNWIGAYWMEFQYGLRE